MVQDWSLLRHMSGPPLSPRQAFVNEDLPNPAQIICVTLKQWLSETTGKKACCRTAGEFPGCLVVPHPVNKFTFESMLFIQNLKKWVFHGLNIVREAVKRPPNLLSKQRCSFILVYRRRCFRNLLLYLFVQDFKITNKRDLVEQIDQNASFCSLSRNVCYNLKDL